MTAGQRKPENQWTGDERKAANLDQRLKSLIMSVLPDDQINYVINYLTAKSTWDDLILYHEGPSDMKESRVMDLKLCYNIFKFKEGESLTQTFTRYKALMNELVNDGIKLSKLEINTGFINGLPKKWLSFCQSLRNTDNVKDSDLGSLFGKPKYEENLIDNIYKTKKNKSLVSVTPLLTAFFSSFIVQDFQDSPDDEEDTRSSHEYLNDLEKEYQARAILAKSKRFFNKVTKRFSSAKATDQTECHKCGKKGHFAKEVSSDDNEMVEVKVLMALGEENEAVSKEGARNSEWVKISMRKCDIRKPIWYLDSRCSRHMTGVKSYLHKYVEQLGPKVVFGDDSTCTTEGYGSIKCNGIVFTKVAFVNGLKYNLISISQLCDAKYIVQFDKKRGTIFNSNKEAVMITLRVRDVYVLDMTSCAQESCFFAKASENLKWIWHKRLAHLNFKTINKLAKQNLVTSSIKKCLHLLHMDLFGHVTPRSINHEKYTLVIVDEYSRNSILLNFCDEKGISQNFSFVERKNRTLIEAARTMLSTSVFLNNIGLKLYQLILHSK
ncbi:retrovirus-related pol polyprotein from transposon TNT 1-94 [Tanacetum coccineum]